MAATHNSESKPSEKQASNDSTKAKGTTFNPRDYILHLFWLTCIPAVLYSITITLFIESSTPDVRFLSAFTSLRFNALHRLLSSPPDTLWRYATWPLEVAFDVVAFAYSIALWLAVIMMKAALLGLVGIACGAGFWMAVQAARTGVKKLVDWDIRRRRRKVLGTNITAAKAGT